MKNTLSILSISVILCLMMMACADSDVATTPENNTAPEASETREKAVPEPESGENTEPEVEEEPEAAPEPADEGPRRIRFARGKSEGTERVGLGAGESQRFVIGVSGGQHLYIEVEDFRPTINMISTSKVTDVSEDEGENTYYALTKSDGDIIFEIKNDTRSSIATTVKVAINTKVY